MLTKVAVVLALIFALSACSGDGDDSPEPTSPTSGETTATTAPLPACEDIWKDGEELPEDYRGCGKEGDTASLAAAVACEDGRKLVIHAESYYAITGEEITKTDVSPLEDTDEYTKVFNDCKGE